jgi:LmbE family N-acetylglucosaminyl deacetylase
MTETGNRVSVICFGNGDEAFTEVEDRKSASAKFLREAVEAHKVLGVENFECFDVPDFAVQQNRESYRRCIKSIRKHQPDIVIGHYWAEYFQHHEMATQSRDAWFQAGWNCSADLGSPWKAKKYYHYEVLHPLQEPTHLIDVSDSFDAKMEAWNKFETAEKHLGSLAGQLEARARYHGSKIGVKYAEALKQSFFTPETINTVEELF